MERLAQFLDDLDDLVYMTRMACERFRKYLLLVLVGPFAVALPVAGILLALAHPPLALATALLLFVSLLYRTVTSPTLEISV
jgi:hypothetical protein